MCGIESSEFTRKQRDLTRIACVTCGECVIVEEAVDPEEVVRNVKAICIDPEQGREIGLEACVDIVRRNQISIRTSAAIHPEYADLLTVDGLPFVVGGGNPFSKEQ